jgi:hypothetical protein
MSGLVKMKRGTCGRHGGDPAISIVLIILEPIVLSGSGPTTSEVMRLVRKVAKNNRNPNDQGTVVVWRHSLLLLACIFCSNNFFFSSYLVDDRLIVDKY